MAFDVSLLRVSVRGLACRTAEARGDSTGAVLGHGYAAHHLRVVSAIRVWLGNEFGFRRPSLEREVQLDVRVHCSSCGTLRGVVHSPLRESIIVATGGCLRRDVVVVGVSLQMVLTILYGTACGRCLEIHHLYFQYQGDVGVFAC